MKTVLTACALVASLGFAAPAAAQSMVAAPNADSRALGECLVAKSTGEDRMTLIRWMGSSIASAPQLSSIIKVDQAAKEQADRAMANLFSRLFAKECGDKTKVLMAKGDQAGIKAAGGMLGEIAMGELMAKPEANAALMAYLKFVDFAQITALLK